MLLLDFAVAILNQRQKKNPTATGPITRHQQSPVTVSKQTSKKTRKENWIDGTVVRLIVKLMNGWMDRSEDRLAERQMDGRSG